MPVKTLQYTQVMKAIMSTFYTSDGEQSDTFEFDGYFTVKDSRTDEDVAGVPIRFMI